jgi:hypothetical protein
MTAFYGLYGEVSLRKCAEVDELIERFTSCPILEIEVDRSEPGAVAISIEGCGLLPHAAGIEMEELLKALGPFALKPAILISDYEHSEDVLIVASSEQAQQRALSRYRMEQISRMMGDILPEHRKRLAELAAASDP